MPNRLTPLYSKIYYKEENYLKVKTIVFKYITPPYSKGLSMLVCQYISILYSYVPIFLYFKLLIMYCLYDSAYPLSYSFTGFISSAFCVLILTYLRLPLNIYTILFIKFIIPTPSSLSLSLKSSFISKLLIRDVLYPILI